MNLDKIKDTIGKIFAYLFLIVFISLVRAVKAL